VEFVVDDIKTIVWNSSSFDNLAIPSTKKKVIIALAKAHISRALDDMIDDFVESKGQDLITLLQYDLRRSIFHSRLIRQSSESFEVNKTLIVEELFEYLKRPLYAIRYILSSSFDYFDFLDICWEARLGRKDV